MLACSKSGKAWRGISSDIQASSQRTIEPPMPLPKLRLGQTGEAYGLPRTRLRLGEWRAARRPKRGVTTTGAE